MEAVTLESLNENVNELKEIVLALREHFEDISLDSEEESLLESCIENEKSGSLTSSEDMKTELDL